MHRGKISKKHSTTYIDVYGRKVHVVTERNAVKKFEAIAKSRENQFKEITE